MAFLAGYDTVASYVTFIVNEDRFPCYDGKGADYIPDPIISEDAFNRSLRFSTRKPGFVDVDWGDGTKDQYPLVKVSDGSYRIIFRSLDIEYKKNPDDTVWWHKKEDGSQYIPVPPHKYSDIRRREVTMRFSNLIDGEFNMDGIVLHEFPITNLPDITYLAMTRSVLKNGDIPYDRISKSVNLRNIQMGVFSHSGVWSNWPEGFLNMKDLRYFGCNSVFNFGDDPDSNWRRFSEWKNLTEFNFNWCNIPSYDPAFNSIPAVGINIISDRNNIPVFDEVDKVGDDKAGVDFMGNGSSWEQDLVGGKLNKIQRAYCSSSTVPVDDLPDYLYEIREFRVWNLRDGGRFINTQERADTFVNTFYDKIMSWSYITMSQTASDGNRNQFYKLTLDLYTAVAPTNKRPSGVYQAPDGFVKGVSNGNPTTPMEKVYVLTNNYEQTWVLAPALASKAALTRARRAGKTRITPFVLGVKDGHVSVFSGDVLDESMSKYSFADKYEAIDICSNLGLDSSPVVEYFRRIEEGEV
jgi:hypothetical protein|nr:MAG TPA: hypothetical protein [Caudoviricetes sp.]